MGDKSNTLLFIQIVVAIASFVCTVAVIRKIISFHARLVIAAVVFILCAATFTYLGVAIPLSFFSESKRTQLALTVDIMMFSSIGLVLVGIICFAVDHMYERPTFLVLAAAAIFSIGSTPFLYKFQQDSYNTKYEITIVEPEEIPPPLPAPRPLGK